MPASSFFDTLPSLGQSLALLGVFAFVMLALFFNRLAEKRTHAGMAESRQKVDELYRRTVVEAEDARFAFRADTATILRDEEEPGNHSGGEYALTRYARNPEGEYFMLMFEVNGGVPKLVFTKLMEQHIARYVLKEKYIAPPLL
ncbi:MAG TPA: hypothetical protein VIU46_01790 [Gallionellaceae bacterium]